MYKYALIVAGGMGKRMRSDIPKQFLPLRGIPILMHTIKKFFQADDTVQIIVIIPKSQWKRWHNLIKIHSFSIPHQLVEGGATRFQSVKNGLSKISKPGESLVAIHDAVRPFVSVKIIRLSFKTALEKGSAVTAVPVIDSIRKVMHSENKALDRKNYWLVQTPQTFWADTAIQAYIQKEQPFFTDDASVIEHAQYTISLLKGSYENIKITTSKDMKIAHLML